jgi:hypothetical protein
MKSHLLNAVCNSFRLCLLSLPLVMPSPSPAALVDLNAAKDNTIYFQSLPSPGSGTDSSQGAGEAMFVGASGAGIVQRGLIAFDLNAIPAGSTINSATLTMDVNRISSYFTGSMDIDLWRLTSDWGEGSESSAGPYGGGGDGAPATAGTATWDENFFLSSNWITAGGDFSASTSASTTVTGTGPVNWSGANLVADIQAWVDGELSNFGWLLLGDESGGKGSVRLSTKEHTLNPQPLLTIDYTPAAVVPVPAAAWLFGSGLLGLTLFARRKKAGWQSRYSIAAP